MEPFSFSFFVKSDEAGDEKRWTPSKERGFDGFGLSLKHVGPIAEVTF